MEVETNNKQPAAGGRNDDDTMTEHRGAFRGGTDSVDHQEEDVDMDDEEGGENDGEEIDQKDGDSDEEDSGDKEQEINGQHAKHPPNTAQRRRHPPKIFDDAITILVPLEVTADLKVAVKHTREKRIKAIFKLFPSIQKQIKKSDKTADEDAEVDGEENDEESKAEEKSSASSKVRKKLENIPQPERFGSVLDYLEAKYVKGVMLDENGDEDDADLEDRSEGQGSVYSKDSFLDDTDLQRDVAEQVMATSTLTKLELEEDDGEFFVNVGNLEVENDEYGEQYDPILDKENAANKKKRKKAATPKAATSTAKNATADPPKKKKAKEGAVAAAAVVTGKEAPGSAKSKKSNGLASTVKTKMSAKKEGSKQAKNTESAKVARAAKKRVDTLHKKIVGLIKKLTDEDLPKKHTKLKVALTCPSNKKPGDDITFTNPHNPGQRLRVKVPKDGKPGGTFKVTVPVKHPEADSDSNKDHNNLGRDLQDTLDDYSRVYDDWCTAQSQVDKSFESFKEKQSKFDKMLELFPIDLLTPVDANYLRHAVRRARQNKYKRSKTAAAKRQQSSPTVKKEPGKQTPNNQESEEEEQELKPQGQIVDIPGTGRIFPSLDWDSKDFTFL